MEGLYKNLTAMIGSFKNSLLLTLLEIKDFSFWNWARRQTRQEQQYISSSRYDRYPINTDERY